MFKNRFKLFLASTVFVLALIGGITTLNAQQANWCHWDRVALDCNWTANDGLCAVSGDNCDVPVVE